MSTRHFPSWPVIALVVVAAACQDDRGGFQQTAPRADGYVLGTSDQVPEPGDFEPVADDGVISIDFETVDVASVARRYLFVRNGGQSVLRVSEISAPAGSSSAFVVACNTGSGYVDPCPASAAQPLEVAAGAALVLQLAYAPQQVGSDQADYLVVSNADDHPTLTLRLQGRAVSPEIQVCISDCQGDEQGDACAGAAELCNDQVAAEGLAIDFGAAQLDEQRRRRVTIRNLGDRELLVGNLGITSGSYNQFSLDTAGQQLPGSLAAGGEARLWVEYRPRSGGAHQSLLAVGSDDVDEPTVTVELVGQGMAPRLCPEPLSLDFGNVPTGESKVLSFTVSNCGLLELRLDAVAMNPDPPDPDFSLPGLPAFPLTLVPGEQVEIAVEYSPQERGSDHGGVDLFSNDPASQPASGLTGTIVLYGESTPRECDIVATPFAVNFGGVVQGTEERMDLIVSNQGTDTCTLDGVEITGNSSLAEFSLVVAPAAGEQLQPGDTRVVTIAYQPADLGRDQGVLSIFGNDKDGNTVLVDLNGEGVEEAACDVVIQPAPLVNFGLVKLGNTKAMQVQITNQGLAACTLENAFVELIPVFGQDFSLTAAPPLPATLGPRGAPNSSTTVEVTFAPQREWGQVGVLHLAVDDSDLGDLACTDGNGNPLPGEACLNLTAYSKKSDLEIVPAELDFGVVTVGCNSPELCVNVYNLGTVDISIDAISLDPPADPNFEISAAPMTPFMLGGSQSFPVCLRYHPQDANPHRAVLIINADGDEEHTVPLFGRGTTNSDQTDVFFQPDRVRSDVLFVVDCSGSMSDDQQNLANNFDAFINWALTLDVDFHIGVIGTEVEDNPGYTGTPPRQVHPGVLVNTSATPKILTSQTPNLNDAFTDNVRLGDDCSNHEAGLEAAWMALSQPLVDDPEANAGFLREDAKLYIIILSDEPDQSKGTPDFYVDFFRSLKGYRNTEMMTVSAICADNPPDGRYYFVTQQTGGIFESILTADWASTLQSLGFDAFAAIREFPLSRPADAGSITVTVNGNPVPQASSPGGADGWTYYPDTNTIYFGDDYVPDKGDRIEVHYSATCL